MSALEAEMAQVLHFAGFSEGMEREHRFAPDRRWRFDFAWPAAKLALEVEGGTWSGGRHTRGKGFAEDCVKYSRAAVLGWRVIRATGDHVRSGEALQWVGAVLGKGPAP